MAQESMKSISLMRDLRDRLKVRLPDRTITEQQDADGYPALLIAAASPTTLTGNMILRMRPIQDDQAKVDALGLSQRIFTPHQLDILLQKTASTDTPANAPVQQADLGAETIAQGDAINSVVFEASRQGVILQFWNQADDTDAVVALAQFAAAAKAQTLRNLWAPLNGDV